MALWGAWKLPPNASSETPELPSNLAPGFSRAPPPPSPKRPRRPRSCLRIWLRGFPEPRGAPQRAFGTPEAAFESGSEGLPGPRAPPKAPSERLIIIVSDSSFLVARAHHM